MTGKKWVDMSFKDKMSSVLCISAFAVGVLLIFIGLFLPPVGEVSNSVLVGTGTFLSFCGAIMGINIKYRYETEKMKTELEESITKRLNKNEE